MGTFQSSPPDFPVYGLANDAWDGPRWLRFFEGAAGEVPVGVHLAHGRSSDLALDSGPWVEVRSLPRRRFAPGAGHTLTGGSLRDVAEYAWMSRGFGSTDLHEHLAQTQSGSCREWPIAEWTLDGGVVEARVVPDHPDARGVWAAFAAAPETFVVVASRGTDPDQVRLTRVLDGSTYGVALAATLDFPGSIERSIARAFGSVDSD